MLSSLLSKSSSAKIPDWIISVITWICRLGVGITFVFSGFVKAIDPWGTVYKFEEYFSALGLPNIHAFIVASVFALFTLEFLVGVFMILGCYRRSNPVVALLFMAVMLPLTLWIAIADPVKDCGCFGDALVISNWATFWKNVVLTAMAVWLLKYNRRSASIISPAFQWLGTVASIGFVGAISFFGYFTQPLIDFRPYPVGESLVSEDEAGNEQTFVFVYRKGDETKEFGEDDELPSEEDGWEFVERKDIFPAASATASEGSSDKTFRIWDIQGDEDLTSDVVSSDEPAVILLIPELYRISPAATWRINALCKWAEMNNINMFAVLSGSSESISEWEDLSMPAYPIYTADDTAVKEVVRGNPGVLFLDQGKIVWKRTLDSIDVDRLTTDNPTPRPESLSLDSRRILLNIIYLYLGVMAFVICLSMLPRIRNVYRSRNIAASDKTDTKSTEESTSESNPTNE